MFLAKALVTSFALACIGYVAAVGPAPGQIQNLVTFGDSYSDVVSLASVGLVAWPVLAAQYGGFQLFPFARAGATCSNNLTSVPFPSVFESQLPLYFTERQNGSLKALDPEKTLYTLWIGTNDVGASTLLTGQQAKGVTVVDTVRCAVNWIKSLYKSGARNFVLQNMIPLQHVPLYSPNSYPNHYWDAPRNTTEWSLFMTELVNSGNEISKLMLQALPPSLPGAHIGLFDSYGLFSDIIAHPNLYLNGTAPLNTTGAVVSCIFSVNESTSGIGDCTIATGTDADSFLWWDELHPSQQTDRVVARELVAGIQRRSARWTTWFS